MPSLRRGTARQRASRSLSKVPVRAGLPTDAVAPGMKTMIVRPTDVLPRGLPQPGEQLGHYRIIGLLGQGGMGAVYRPRTPGKWTAGGAQGVEPDARFARARASGFSARGGWRRPSIIRTAFTFSGRKKLAEHPPSRWNSSPAARWKTGVREKGPLPVSEAVDGVLQIIAGLEAAQRIGILHRDVKPSNCFRKWTARSRLATSAFPFPPASARNRP